MSQMCAYSAGGGDAVSPNRLKVRSRARPLEVYFHLGVVSWYIQDLLRADKKSLIFRSLAIEWHVQAKYAFKPLP